MEVRARRANALAEEALERPGLPDRRGRRAEAAPRRGQGRRARERPGREPAGRAARPCRSRQDSSTLILIDEVLMYAREKVGLDPAWRSRLVNFFQYLTQAATKVDRCAIVASLLATEPSKSDALGKEIAQELFTIFRRERRRASSRSEGGRGRGPAPPVLHARVDPRPRGVPAARRRRAQGRSPTTTSTTAQGAAKPPRSATSRATRSTPT